MPGGLALSEGQDIAPDLNTAAIRRRFRLSSDQAVRDRVRRGTLPQPSYRLGRTPYWTEADLEEFLRGGDAA